MPNALNGIYNEQTTFFEIGHNSKFFYVFQVELSNIIVQV
jgi:hypothetical protein